MGGALEAEGESVQPGVLSATGLPVPSEESSQSFLLPNSIDGRRLALAKWVAQMKPFNHTLYSQPIWQNHFGQAIARNPNNFGAKGAKPTHPKLLDYLASSLVEHDWKIKRLHKLIMTSKNIYAVHTTG